MKFGSLVFAAAASASAVPEILKRDPQQTQNEAKSGACKPIFFIMARGSTEPGNMGMTMGPQVCSQLKQRLGADKVGCQGVGGAYKASVMDNVTYRSGAGTSPASIAEATKEFNNVAKKCPNSKIIFSGYSQGAALMHATVSKLPSDVKSKAVAGVLFGDTKNKQSGGSIASYPKDKVLIICSKDDGVCWGQLNVNAGHMSYIRDGSAKKATDFLIAKLGMTGSAAPAAASSAGSSGGSMAGTGKGKGKGIGRSKGTGKRGVGKMGRAKGKGSPPEQPSD